MKIVNKLFLLLILPLCLIAHGPHAQHIIFDFPATLATIDKKVFFNDVIGYFSGVKLLIGGNLSGLLNLENTTFETLEKLGKQECTSELQVQTPEGRVLPQIFCDWLTDTITPIDAAKKALHHVKKTLPKGTERDVIARIAEAIFDTKQLSKHWLINDGGLKLVQDCADRYGQQNLYIIANWNSESMIDIMSKAKHMQPLMKHFAPNRIFVSGKTKILLPNIVCFEKVVKQCQLNPHECIFISGIEHHVNAARKFGMRAVLIPDGNYSKAREELKVLGIL